MKRTEQQKRAGWLATVVAGLGVSLGIDPTGLTGAPPAQAGEVKPGTVVQHKGEARQIKIDGHAAQHKLKGEAGRNPRTDAVSQVKTSRTEKPAATSAASKPRNP